MSPSSYPENRYDIRFEELKGLAAKSGWSEDYLKLAMKSDVETVEKASSSKGKRISISGNHCFVKKVDQRSKAHTSDSIKNLKIPILILQGRDDDPLSVEAAAAFDKTLEEGGNITHTLTYFGYLGHFFGKRVNNGFNRIYYETDESVLGNIRDWLKSRLI